MMNFKVITIIYFIKSNRYYNFFILILPLIIILKINYFINNLSLTVILKLQLFVL